MLKTKKTWLFIAIVLAGIIFISVYLFINNSTYSKKELKFYEVDGSYSAKESENANVYTYKCHTDTCEFLSEQNFFRYVLIHDDEYYLYDLETHSTTKINISKKVESASTRFYEDKYYIVLSFIDETNSLYYVNENRYLFENEHLPIYKYYDFIQTNIVTFYTGEKFVFYSLKESKYLGEFSSETSTYYIIGDNIVRHNYDKGTYTIYSDEFNIILSETDYNISGLDSDGNLILSRSFSDRGYGSQELYLGYGVDRTFKVYNQEGELVKESKKYKAFQIVVDENYYLAIDEDNYLKLYDMEEKILAKLAYWSDEKAIRQVESKDNQITIFTGTNTENSVEYAFDVTSKKLIEKQLDYIVNKK